MPDGSVRPSRIRRLLHYATNPITVLGVILTTVSGVLIVVFVIHDMIVGTHTHYTAILSYMFLPTLFVAGLFIMPVGMWRRRRQLIAQGVAWDQVGAFPRLDFNDPQLRRISIIVVSLTLVNSVVLGASTYMGIEYMETVEFCGTLCHSVMQPEYTAYQESPHSRVRCVECHIGPGAPWFVRSKLDGVRQVFAIALNTYERPIPSPVHTLRPARETCEQCHWPEKHYGDRLRVYGRFEADEENTPAYSAMLLKTGGGSLSLGDHGGIHWWHIYSDNRIRYVASDEDLQEVVWVELTRPDGEVRTYTREDDDVPSPEEIEAKAHVMDCIDCHNRPTHLFETPSNAVDSLLSRNRKLVELPYFKREAVRSLQDGYPTHEAGMRAVREAIRAFYQSEYPDLAEGEAQLIGQGAEAVAEIYGRSVFPEMNVSWKTHPNNIGHEDYPGCNRCHDDEMETEDGEYVISEDCEICHTVLVEDSPTVPDFSLLIEDE